MPKTILITGGSGFIGTKLTHALLEKGYKVVVVDMRAPETQNEYVVFENINLSSQNIPEKYDGELHGIIHLAGKNIFGRWTDTFKKEIYDSRILSTRKIVETVSTWKSKPKVLVTASAFGFYGDAGEDEIDERTSVGKDFLATVCRDWENEAKKIESHGVRAVQIRTAHVLGRGGLLAPLFVPFKFGLGAWIGSGKTWLPWVHIDDIVNIYVYTLETDALSGPLNTNAPEKVRQKAFMKLFGEVMHRKVLFSIPIFALYLRYGELALTFNNSARMTSQKLINSGYVFMYPQLREALRSVVNTH